MASPTFKRIVRTVAWAVLGWLILGLVAGVGLTALAVIEDDGGSSVVVTLVALLGALAGATYGWRHGFSPGAIRE